MTTQALIKRRGYTAVLTLISLVCLPIFVNGQCNGTYFKTSYRKIVGAFSVLSVDDWTGDGEPDFWKLVPNAGGTAENLVVYPNNGTGDFDWSNPIIFTTTIPVSALPSANIVDFNSDGRKDLYIWSQGSLTIYLNSGNNSFSALTTNTFPVADGSPLNSGLGFFDVNSDGIADLVQAVSIPFVGHEINYRLGSSDGSFGSKVVLVSGTSIIETYKIKGDFNGDGRIDIAYQFSNANGRFLKILFNNGDGTFTAGPDSPSTGSNIPTVVDITGDGKADLLTVESTGPGQPSTRYFKKFKSNGDGTFVMSEIPILQRYANGSWYNDPNASEFKIGDFNGDGSPDIVEFGGTWYSIHINDGTGSFSRTDYFTQIGPANQTVLADFNGDNRTDIYQKAPATGGMVNAFGEQLVIIKYPQCQPYGEVKAANYDGSLYNDLVMWNPITGDWSSAEALWLGGDATVKRFNWGLGTLGDEPVIGDWDGDGRSDYAVYRQTNGAWYIYRSLSSIPLIFQFGITGDRPVPADYDGDGLTDAAVFRQSTGDWYIWLTGPQHLMALHWGKDGDRPVPQDYDGDGKTDIAVYRPSEGNWYILKSSDQGYIGLNWGISTDQPVPADYDGDGKSDIAVWRSGVWFILRSSNGAFSPIYWGTDGDIPIPTYINRESAVPVVFRPSNSVWYDYQEPGSARGVSASPSAPVYVGWNF